MIENTPILNGKDVGITQHFNNVMSKINLKLVRENNTSMVLIMLIIKSSQ